jgi:biopolymer transport protein ExbD
MTFKTHCQISKGLVDAAPLVNVVFLLLLFFVLNSSFVMVPGIKVSLSEVTGIPVTISFQTLVVTVARDDLIFFQDQPISIDKLEPALREAVQQGHGHELIIKAGEQVTHGAEMQIESAAYRAGITTINWAVRPGESGAGAN